MTKHPNPHLPRDPGITDYENALLAFDELGPPRLDRAIIAAIPAKNGVARYVYDYTKLLQIYADFREVDMDGEVEEGESDRGDDEKILRFPGVESNAERLDQIHATITSMMWGSPSEGVEPLLATDPEIEPLGLDCGDEEPTVLIVKGKEFWIVT